MASGEAGAATIGTAADSSSAVAARLAFTARVLAEWDGPEPIAITSMAATAIAPPEAIYKGRRDLRHRGSSG